MALNVSDVAGSTVGVAPPVELPLAHAETGHVDSAPFRNPMYRKYSERIDKLASVFTTSDLVLWGWRTVPGCGGG